MAERRGKKKVLNQLFDPNSEFFPYLKAILDAIPHGVIVTNEDSEICFANIRYFTEKIKGSQSPAEFIGLSSSDVTDIPLASQVLDDGKARLGIKKKRTNGTPYYCDVVPLTVDGTVIGTFGYGQEYTLEKLYKENSGLLRSNQRLISQVRLAYQARYQFADFWGECDNILDVKRLAMKMANMDSDILIVGESGTGKEILAQAIHNASMRANERFVAVNCATLSRDLISSELFGYTEGSFTGAQKGGKPGLFEVADKGTILLDEIAELDADIQAKLLRVLEERSIRRVGGTEEHQIDVRVIALTNKDLMQMVRQGAFRADLYYRLNVLSLEIPPLRERKGDIDLLSEKIMRSFAKKQGRTLSFSTDAKKVLRSYPWPGNVRELRNAVEYATNICSGNVIETTDLPKWIYRSPELVPFDEENDSLEQVLARAEQHAIRTMLRKYGNSKGAKERVAEKLGISLSSLYSKIKKLEDEDGGT